MNMEPAFATGGEAVMVSNQAPKDKMHSTNEGKGQSWEGEEGRPEARAREAGFGQDTAPRDQAARNMS
jgi:hypothetical protein